MVRELKPGVYAVGAIDWDRRLFDELIPLPDGTSYNAYLVRGRDKTARVWLAPRIAEGPVEKIALWVDAITGTESEELGTIRALDTATWLRRRDQLAKSGGPPLPPLITIPVPPRETGAIDLLAATDVSLDAQPGAPAKPNQPGGTWQRTKDAIRSPGNESCRLDLPFFVTRDYRDRKSTRLNSSHRT